jgi:uncharacterized repeat protein (TIGR04076 family)
MEKIKTKITVIKRMINKDLIEDYIQNTSNFSICDKVTDGQEFIVSSPFELPEGMCPSAWADIRPYIMTIACGGSFPFLKNPNITLASCSDLFRPVIFKIERM